MKEIEQNLTTEIEKGIPETIELSEIREGLVEYYNEHPYGRYGDPEKSANIVNGKLFRHLDENFGPAHLDREKNSDGEIVWVLRKPAIELFLKAESVKGISGGRSVGAVEITDVQLRIIRETLQKIVSNSES